MRKDRDRSYLSHWGKVELNLILEYVGAQRSFALSPVSEHKKVGGFFFDHGCFPGTQGSDKFQHCHRLSLFQYRGWSEDFNLRNQFGSLYLGAIWTPQVDHLGLSLQVSQSGVLAWGTQYWDLSLVDQFQGALSGNFTLENSAWGLWLGYSVS